METKKLKQLAIKVVDNVGVGRKENPGIKKAIKSFGHIINEILKFDSLTTDELKELGVKSNDLPGLIDDLKRFEYGPILYEKNGEYIVKKEIGETVKILYSELDPTCEKLAKLVREECWKRGAHVMLSYITDVDKRRMYGLMPEDSLAELNPVTKATTENLDVRFFIGYADDINWSVGLESKLKILAPVNSELDEIANERKTRWCFLGWPVKMKKQNYVVNRKKFEKTFIDALYESFSEQTLNNCIYFQDKLKGRDKIRIIAEDGTDLIFSIKNRRVLLDDAIIDENDIIVDNFGLNIPSGEVFMAPIEDSANGEIIFDFVAIRGFGLVKNLRVRFQDGKVVEYNAEKGENRFRKYLESNVGEIDRIGELGIGCNPKADFIGATLVDEKIFGTIHIAIGANKGSFGGKNSASGHQDMIKFMTGKKSELWADDILVMKDGKIIE
jgi:aminopeptidase